MEYSEFMNDKAPANEKDDNVHVQTAETTDTKSDAGESVLAFIEIPRGSRNKYEYDEENGVFMLDRVLYSSVHYPTDYGFIPNTLAEDGDHLDVCVLMTEPSFPGCLIEARPLGGLDMRDEKGPDFKLLAVPVNDPRFNHYRSLDQVGKHWLREIETFFATYKLLEDKETNIFGWYSLEDAMVELNKAREAYEDAHAGEKVGLKS